MTIHRNRTRGWGAAIAFLGLILSPAAMGAEGGWSIAPSLTFQLHKEQMKDASGNPTTQIASHRQIGLMTAGTKTLHPHFDVGFFLLFENGSRTIIGGDPATYFVFWMGPMARANAGPLFLEVCYVLYGIRRDPSLSGVSSVSGDNSSAFHTDPIRAWLFALGTRIPLGGTVDFFTKVEYRYHYYNERGGNSIQGDASLGTQSIRPHLGVIWKI